MKVKVSEASGVVLDWMVAKCEGVKVCEPVAGLDQRIEVKDPYTGTYSYEFYTPSKDWAQGGPVIERENVLIVSYSFVVGYPCPVYGAIMHKGNDVVWGETMLVAAMRCYVASKLGYEVEVPDELGLK